MANFQKALNLLLGIEKGFANSPNDPGGATNFGITAKMLAAYRRVSVVAPSEVQNLQMPEVTSFYNDEFWQPLNLDQVNSDIIAYAILDQAVNRGPQPAVKDLQSALAKLGKLVSVDGIPGPMTLSGANQFPTQSLIISFMELSQLSYAKLVESNPMERIEDLTGWLARTHRILDLIV